MLFVVDVMFGPDRDLTEFLRFIHVCRSSQGKSNVRRPTFTFLIILSLGARKEFHESTQNEFFSPSKN